MQVEKLSYPYVPGEYGIPFGDLIDQFKTTGKHYGIVTVGSGAEIEFKLFSDLIAVADLAHPDRVMQAELTNRVAFFTLQTRSMLTDDLQSAPDPHPDMFAARFVKFALEYFESMGEEIDICRGEWHYPGDNWRTFMAELLAQENAVKAAKATWSGKLFASLGFSRLRKSDVSLNNTGNNIKVVALFRRPYVVEVYQGESGNGRQ